jgi:hypothetical protein
MRLQAVRKVTCAVLRQMHIEQHKTVWHFVYRSEAAFALPQCKHENYIHIRQPKAPPNRGAVSTQRDFQINAHESPRAAYKTITA